MKLNYHYFFLYVTIATEHINSLRKNSDILSFMVKQEVHEVLSDITTTYLHHKSKLILFDQKESST